MLFPRGEEVMRQNCRDARTRAAQPRVHGGRGLMSGSKGGILSRPLPYDHGCGSHTSVVPTAPHAVTHPVSAAVPHASSHSAVMAAMAPDLKHSTVLTALTIDASLAGYGGRLSRAGGHQGGQTGG